jgi:ribonuclease-3
MHNFSELEKKLKIKFKNKDLLTQAFVHRSYLNENPDLSFSHNERLEFLGDAVLELIVTEYLYKKYPDKPEGELTAWRAALVNAKMLSEIAQKIGFNDFLLLSKGELKEEGKARQFILANTIEAFIGSLYLDRKMDASRKFIEENVLSELPRVLEQHLYRDAKSLFQEKAQEKVGVTPSYKVLREWGPDHAKHFVIGVYLGNELVAEGEGSAKQEGEEEAARLALEIKNW